MLLSHLPFPLQIPLFTMRSAHIKTVGFDVRVSILAFLHSGFIILVLVTLSALSFILQTSEIILCVFYFLSTVPLGTGELHLIFQFLLFIFLHPKRLGTTRQVRNSEFFHLLQAFRPNTMTF